MKKEIYAALKLAGLVTEEMNPEVAGERIDDLRQGLDQAEGPEDALRMLYNWAAKQTIDEDEFVQLAQEFMQNQ